MFYGGEKLKEDDFVSKFLLVVALLNTLIGVSAFSQDGTISSFVQCILLSIAFVWMSFSYSQQKTQSKLLMKLVHVMDDNDWKILNDVVAKAIQTKDTREP